MTVAALDVIHIKDLPFGLMDADRWEPGVARVETSGPDVLAMGEMTLDGVTHPAVIRLSATFDHEAGLGCFVVASLHHVVDGRTVRLCLRDGHPEGLAYRALSPIGVDAFTMTRDGVQRDGATIAEMTLIDRDDDLYHPHEMADRFAELDARLDAMTAAHAAAVAAGTHKAANAVDVSAEGEVVGVDRFGGSPVLAPDQAWPTGGDGLPLAFVAQVDLAGIAPLADTALPGEGVLSIFYDLDRRPWGHEPEHASAVAVLHTLEHGEERAAPEGAVTLEPEGLAFHGQIEADACGDATLMLVRAYIANDGELDAAVFEAIDARLEAAGVRTRAMETRKDPYDDCFPEEAYLDQIPEHYDRAPDLTSIDVDDDAAMAAAMAEAEDYYDSLNEPASGREVAIAPDDVVLTLGGTAEPIQNVMEDDLHDMSLRVHGNMASSSPADWTTLATIRDAGRLDFFDDGRVYLWIMKRDLAARDFSRVLHVLQCG